MIQRSYSLPSCTLLVDGIVTSSDVISILTGFSCRFNHHTEPIVGGLELLNALVKVVGAYAQALKSNILVAIPEKLVRIEPRGKHLHVLSVSLNEADAHNPKQLQIELNTIQLFDLMESLDRLCCDPITLPDLKLVTQISDYRSQSQLNNQALPAIAGVVSLAIAATVLYFIPIPKPQPKPAQTLPVQTKPLPKVSKPPVASPESSASPEASPSPTGSSNPDSSPSPTASPNPTSSSSPETSPTTSPR
ncbi:DUF4335 domain-containing protein [Pseudanabaena sp. 'Roaring Creek']|uniref:DUF4335 domain-containing protein n=1 Tax=Pseudanabaena sp. 'Roaring Creek' TaxID=1681830 RepID=UPI0006D8434D|nr:DUF4335 domain-containing protein [Pseudanabaena sp. 'Roaring Creek']